MLELILFALFFGGCFLFFTGMNYYIIYQAKVKKKDMPSLTPFLGGISGVICILTTGFLYPWLLLLPLLIDPGSIPLVIEFIVLIIKEYTKK